MTPQQGRKLAALIVVAGIFLALMLYFATPSEEQRVKRVLEHAADAVQDEDFDRLTELFSDDFTDDTGISRENWERVVRTGLKVYSDIEIDVSAVRIEIDGDQARITFNATAQGTYVPSLLRGGMPQVDAGRTANVGLLLERRDDQWIVVRAQHLPLDFIPQEALEFLR
ncbi:MAG: nuclear transport factor 2 family protein [Candidatus Alcyoniella australis]|nr:nuclear transport factor 2 family protein [Candidatus Alcyoniella australis]